VSVSSLTLVVVHYHTPALACRAVEELASQAQRDALALDIVVVDNGSDERAREALRELAGRVPLRLVDAGRNLGYAGAANVGLDQARSFALGVMNPDVLVQSGCLRALLAELAAGADVAGPRFTWDEGRRVLVPPAEQRGRLVELLYTLGRRPALAGVARRHWRRHARRHWLATAPFRSEALIGALLTFRREAFESVGPFDAGFPLYFEETDWLARARAAGRRSSYVPEATAVHLYDQSARSEPRARAWFAESAMRFRRRHYGPSWTTLLGRLEPTPSQPPRRAPRWPAPQLALAPGDYWLELSPFPHGFPAAAERWHGDPGSWRLPQEIRRRHPDLELHLRVVADSGRERGCFVLPADDAAPS
jgi:GT2 family glycosyltransferase